MSAVTDTELAAIDRAAERRVEREAYEAAHPEDRVHSLFESILATHAQVPVAISAGLQGERGDVAAKRVLHEGGTL